MVEDVGAEIFREAGCDPRNPPEGGAVRLAIELYGGDCIRESDRAQTEAEPGRIGSARKIFVAARLTPRRMHFAIAHAVARIEIAKRCIDLDADKLAAFLVAPPVAFAERVDRVGLDLPTLAQTFAVTETCAALRVVEVGVGDGLVVTPAKVYRPGSLLSWADDGAARALARGAPRSVRKVRISDEPGRVALYRLAG